MITAARNVCVYALIVTSGIQNTAYVLTIFPLLFFSLRDLLESNWELRAPYRTTTTSHLSFDDFRFALINILLIARGIAFGCFRGLSTILLEIISFSIHFLWKNSQPQICNEKSIFKYNEMHSILLLSLSFACVGFALCARILLFFLVSLRFV